MGALPGRRRAEREWEEGVWGGRMGQRQRGKSSEIRQIWALSPIETLGRTCSVPQLH